MTCKVPNTGRDFFVKSLDHYCGFVMPISWFEQNGIQGANVANGWIVTSKKFRPWYLDEVFGSEKLRPETFLFQKVTKIAMNAGHQRELITSRDETDMKVICSALNACQLAFHNISLKILNEKRFYATEEERNDLDYIISEHKSRRDKMTKPSKEEMCLISRFLPRLMLDAPKGKYEHSFIFYLRLL